MINSAVMKKWTIFVFLLFFPALTAEAQWSIVYPKLSPTDDLGVMGSDITFSHGMLWTAPQSAYYGVPQIIFSSFDSGKTWTSHTVDAYDIRAIRFLDKTNGVMSSHGTSNTITHDGGNTWISLNLSGFEDMAMIGTPGNIIIAGDAGSIGISHDSGRTNTWIPSQNLTPTSFVITPKATVFASNNPVLVSTDFGYTWQTKSGSNPLVAFSMDVGKLCDDSTLYIIGLDENVVSYPNSRYSEIYISTDAGNSFITRYSHSPLRYFNGAVVTSRHAAFVGTTLDGIFRTTDHGQTWIPIGGPPLAFNAKSVAAINDNIIFALDTAGNLWETTNSGGMPITPPSPPAPIIASTSAMVTSCDSGNLTAFLMHTYCDALTITDAELTGADANNFTLQPQPLPIALGNGAKINFSVSFNPKKQARSFSAGIHVKGFYLFEYDDTVKIDTVIPINGISTPVAPNLFVRQSVYTFDTLSACAKPIDTAVTFINLGCDTLTITDTSGMNTSAFTILQPFTLPIKIIPGDSVTIRFQFMPTGAGSFIAQPKFTARQQNLSQTVSLLLKGYGKSVVDTLLLNPKVFNFQSFSICEHDSAKG
jgi:photosystem II stability/assembly factor-like uncharacterized protein